MTLIISSDYTCLLDNKQAILFKLSVTSAVFSWRTAMNSSLKRKNKLTKTLFNLYCYILGKGKIKPLNICIKPDFYKSWFPANKKEK